MAPEKGLMVCEIGMNWVSCPDDKGRGGWDDQAEGSWGGGKPYELRVEKWRTDFVGWGGEVGCVERCDGGAVRETT